MSLSDNLKLISIVESRDDKEYQAFKSVSKELNKLKTILILHKSDIEHMDEVSRVEFWSEVEDILRLCAKTLEEAHTPTDDEILERLDDRPLTSDEAVEILMKSRLETGLVDLEELRTLIC